MASTSPSLPPWQIGLLVSLVVVIEAAGVVAGVATTRGASLAAGLPPSSPPPVAYPIVWSVLYAIAAVALWLQCVAPSQAGSIVAPGIQWTSVALLGAQLLLSFGWTAIWTSGNTRAATWLVVGMLALAVPGVILAARVSIIAAALWAPYLVWLVFALVLCSEVNTTRRRA